MERLAAPAHLQTFDRAFDRVLFVVSSRVSLLPLVSRGQTAFFDIWGQP